MSDSNKDREAMTGGMTSGRNEISLDSFENALPRRTLDPPDLSLDFFTYIQLTFNRDLGAFNEV
jgi:hypothetical protein